MLATTNTENLRKAKDASSTVVFHSTKRISRLTEAKAGHTSPSTCGVTYTRNRVTYCLLGDNEEGRTITTKDPKVKYSPEDNHATDVQKLAECSSIKELELIKCDNDW